MKVSCALVAATFLAGCVVIPVPVPHGQILEGTEVKASDLAFLRTGQTTKADVLARLGSPTIIWRDENIFVYRWVQRKGVLLWMIGGGYQGDAGVADITAEYAYLIKFDTTDRFVTSETIQIPAWKSFGQALLDWRNAQRTGKVRVPTNENKILPND